MQPAGAWTISAPSSRRRDITSLSRGAMSTTRRAAEVHWVVSHMSQMTTATFALIQSCRIRVSGSPLAERDRRLRVLAITDLNEARAHRPAEDLLACPVHAIRPDGTR